jgi:hypothetical protein
VRTIEFSQIRAQVASLERDIEVKLKRGQSWVEEGEGDAISGCRKAMGRLKGGDDHGTRMGLGKG